MLAALAGANLIYGAGMLEAGMTFSFGQLVIDDEIAAMVPRRSYEEPMILPFGKEYYGPGIANMGAAVQVGKL